MSIKHKTCKPKMTTQPNNKSNIPTVDEKTQPEKASTSSLVDEKAQPNLYNKAPTGPIAPRAPRGPRGPRGSRGSEYKRKLENTIIIDGTNYKIYRCVLKNYSATGPTPKEDAFVILLQRDSGGNYFSVGRYLYKDSIKSNINGILTCENDGTLLYEPY